MIEDDVHMLAQTGSSNCRGFCKPPLDFKMKRTLFFPDKNPAILAALLYFTFMIMSRTHVLYFKVVFSGFFLEL